MSTDKLPFGIRTYGFSENITADAATRLLANWRALPADERQRCFKVKGMAYTLDRALAVERRTEADAAKPKREPFGIERVVAALCQRRNESGGILAV